MGGIGNTLAFNRYDYLVGPLQLIGVQGYLLNIVEFIHLTCSGFFYLTTRGVANPRKEWGVADFYREVEVVHQNRLFPCVLLGRGRVVPYQHHTKSLAPSGDGDLVGFRLSVVDIVIKIPAVFQCLNGPLSIHEPVAELEIGAWPPEVCSGVGQQVTE